MKRENLYFTVLLIYASLIGIEVGQLLLHH